MTYQLSEHLRGRIAWIMARGGHPGDTVSIVSALIDSDVGKGEYLLPDGEVDEAAVDLAAEHYTAAVNEYREEQAS